MKNRFLIGGLLFLAIWVVWSGVSRVIPSYIGYRGERIKLTRYYLDYDGYKNDPNNIDPSETQRVQQLVMSAPIDAQFQNRAAAVAAVFDIKFPGYGAGSMPLHKLPDGDTVTGFSVEIPRLNKERYFVFRSHNDVYTLMDDFVADEPPLLFEVQAERGEMVFFGMDHKPVLRRKLNVP